MPGNKGTTKTNLGRLAAEPIIKKAREEFDKLFNGIKSAAQKVIELPSPDKKIIESFKELKLELTDKRLSSHTHHIAEKFGKTALLDLKALIKSANIKINALKSQHATEKSHVRPLAPRSKREAQARVAPVEVKHTRLEPIPEGIEPTKKKPVPKEAVPEVKLTPAQKAKTDKIDSLEAHLRNAGKRFLEFNEAKPGKRRDLFDAYKATQADLLKDIKHVSEDLRRYFQKVNDSYKKMVKLHPIPHGQHRIKHAVPPTTPVVKRETSAAQPQQTAAKPLANLRIPSVTKVEEDVFFTPTDEDSPTDYDSFVEASSPPSTQETTAIVSKPLQKAKEKKVTQDPVQLAIQRKIHNEVVRTLASIERMPGETLLRSLMAERRQHPRVRAVLDLPTAKKEESNAIVPYTHTTSAQLSTAQLMNTFATDIKGLESGKLTFLAVNFGKQGTFHLGVRELVENPTKMISALFDNIRRLGLKGDMTLKLTPSPVPMLMDEGQTVHFGTDKALRLLQAVATIGTLAGSQAKPAPASEVVVQRPHTQTHFKPEPIPPILGAPGVASTVPPARMKSATSAKKQTAPAAETPPAELNSPHDRRLNIEREDEDEEVLVQELAEEVYEIPLQLMNKFHDGLTKLERQIERLPEKIHPNARKAAVALKDGLTKALEQYQSDLAFNSTQVGDKESAKKFVDKCDKLIEVAEKSTLKNFRGFGVVFNIFRDVVNAIQKALHIKPTITTSMQKVNELKDAVQKMREELPPPQKPSQG